MKGGGGGAGRGGYAGVGVGGGGWVDEWVGGGAGGGAVGAGVGRGVEGCWGLGWMGGGAGLALAMVTVLVVAFFQVSFLQQCLKERILDFLLVLWWWCVLARDGTEAIPANHCPSRIYVVMFRADIGGDLMAVQAEMMFNRVVETYRNLYSPVPLQNLLYSGNVDELVLKEIAPEASLAKQIS